MNPVEAAAAVRAKISTDPRKAWRQSVTGRAIRPLDPRPGDYAIEDIAQGLAGTNRYGGQGSRYYSNAEHCVLVSLCGDPAYARWKLLHDAHEAITGVDMPAPIKRLPQMRWWIDEVETPIDHALMIQFNAHDVGDTAEIDRRILHDERSALFGPPPMPWNIPGSPLGVAFVFARPELAKDLFLRRFEELFPEYAGP